MHNENNMAQIRKIIHVEMLQPIDGQTHFYFGSKAAIFQRFTPEQIGLSYKMLRNIGSLKDSPFSNNKCIIRQGELIASNTRKEDEEC